MNTLAPTFFIGSSSIFQVMRTTIKLGQSLNFGQIRPRDAELQPLINVKLVFAKNLENGWTEFNQILYTHDHQEDLYKFCKASFLASVQQSYGP